MLEGSEPLKGHVHVLGRRGGSKSLSAGIFTAFQRRWCTRLEDVTETSQIHLSFGFLYIRKCWLFLYRYIADTFFNL